jgi:hypothetical protein
MKKNLYYKTIYGRGNGFKAAFLSFFFALSSWPRLLLEVFIRKNFGERYFSFIAACMMVVVLGIMPLIIAGGMHIYMNLNRFNGSQSSFDFVNFLLHYLTWYVFLAAFIKVCRERDAEVKRLPSVFDFARFSLSTGEIHPDILAFKWYGRNVTIREVETLVEPAIFFFLGLFLNVLGQRIGIIIVLSSIIYSLSYAAAYWQGDHFVMDKIDEMICNEEIVASFVDGRPPSETRGVPFYGRRPADPEIRRRVADCFMEDFEETIEAK